MPDNVLSDNNVLVGQTILDVYLADDRQAIKFVLADGRDLVARCDGDCCSRTWIEAIENVDAIIGSPVLRAVDIDMPDEPHPEDADKEVVAYYGFQIETAKGTCTLDYRNESNGYYGGNLSWPADSHFYGGVYGQNVSTMVWQKLGGV